MGQVVSQGKEGGKKERKREKGSEEGRVREWKKKKKKKRARLLSPQERDAPISRAWLVRSFFLSSSPTGIIILEREIETLVWREGVVIGETLSEVIKRRCARGTTL